MINCALIQAKYNDLYSELRRYIWDFATVEAIADLEVACYETCADLNKIRSQFHKLCQQTQEVARTDEELKAVQDEFEELINSDSEVFVEIPAVQERRE